MKIALVEHQGRRATAVIGGDAARIIGEWSNAALNLDTPFSAAGHSVAQLEEQASARDEALPLSAVKLLPPIRPHAKIVCLGLNYRNHVDETHNDLAENPGLFTKLPETLVGQAVPLIRPKVSERFDFEGEVAVVIGKAGRHIARETAMDHVFGYTIMMDGSVRDYQTHSVSAGKNFWQSGALGPWIVTADEIPDPIALALETRLNGQQVQHTTADLMLYDIPTAISYISRWTQLVPGDIIATGTPGGVGSRRTPPLWMRDGDSIEVEVSGIGVLKNPIFDER